MSRTDHHTPWRHRADRGFETFPRGYGDREIADLARRAERVHRAELRAFRSAATAALRADPDAADTLDAPDARTRHNAVWDAW